MLIGKNGIGKIPPPPKYFNCHPNEKRHPGLPRTSPVWSLVKAGVKGQEEFMSEMCPWLIIIE
jgi:hypothetical protein